MAITLKAARVNAGLSQEQAAERLKITTSTLRSWEKGTTFPTVEKIRMLEDLYSVTYADIIFLPSNSA